MRTKGKRNYRIERVPVTDPSTLSRCEDCEDLWCWRHMDHFSACPCLTPDEAKEQGYAIVKMDGHLVGEKRIEL